MRETDRDISKTESSDTKTEDLVEREQREKREDRRQRGERKGRDDRGMVDGCI